MIDCRDHWVLRSCPLNGSIRPRESIFSKLFPCCRSYSPDSKRVNDEQLDWTNTVLSIRGENVNSNVSVKVWQRSAKENKSVREWKHARLVEDYQVLRTLIRGSYN
jgi:hypothetical protein